MTEEELALYLELSAAVGNAYRWAPRTDADVDRDDDTITRWFVRQWCWSHAEDCSVDVRRKAGVL